MAAILSTVPRTVLKARLVCTVCVLLLAGCSNVPLGTLPATKNVILVIGDGMDAHQVTIARNYLVGPNGKLALDDLPGRASVGLVTVTEEDPATFHYVTDSASTASALAAGVVTSRGRLSTTAGTDEDVSTITELASRAGLGTGVISTAAVTDATPAAFAVNIAARSCKTVKNMQEIPRCAGDRLQAGGPGSIALQLATSNLDVLMGGGRSDFGNGAGSPIETSAGAGFSLLQTRADLSGATLGTRWLGLFADGNFAPRMLGEDGRVAERIGPAGELPAPFACVPNPAADAQPALADMTRRAVEKLERAPGGFFLIVESALIDKASHVRNPCGSIGGVRQLDETVRYLVEFAAGRESADTLIVVTADHTQAAQLVPESTLFAGATPPVRTPGHLARLRLSDGSVMGVNYATNTYFVEEHTGADVPLYTNQPERFPSFLTQTEVFGAMREFLGL